MAGYLQIDREILNSTVWVGTDSDTKALWFFLLLAADINTGIVPHTIPAIIQCTGICRETVDLVLYFFSRPDPDSRSAKNDGRRIEFVDDCNPNGGIRVLNYGEYKEKHLSSSAKRMRRKRTRDRHSDGGVTQCDARDVTVTKEKKKEKEKEKKRRGSSDSFESVSSQILKLEDRYRYAPQRSMIRVARGACALSRKTGTMADTVWLKTLKQLESHSIGTVLEAARRFVEKHGDGEKDERYLIGIARGIARERDRSRESVEAEISNAEINRLDGGI